MYVYLNGEIVKRDEAKVSVGDRGYIFGDGIYEVIRVTDGKLFREPEHLERMKESLHGIKIDFDTKLMGKIPGICRNLLERNNHTANEAIIYIQVTRGTSWPRTHVFPDPPVHPALYIGTNPFNPDKELLVSGIDTITLTDLRWKRCNLKTIQLLPNVLARQQAIESGANSAIMIRDGVVTESPNANIFGVKDGILYTHPVSNYILKGITRQVVIEIANKLGIELKEIPIREEELFELDELFFSGTTTDIQPVVEINDRRLAEGKPGPIVKKIQQSYNELLYSQVN
jgi:D-alanine transaminase